MMLFIGILILVGSAVDIAISAYTGLHLLLFLCGLLLILLNVFGHKLPAGIAVGKTALSLAIIVLTGLSLFGFFTGSKLLESHNAQSVIKKAEKINKASGAEQACAYIEEAAALYDYTRDLAFETAELFSAAGRHDDAIRKYEEILQKDSFDIPARYRYALVQISQKDYNRAISQLNTIIKQRPDEADSLLALGDCYWALGDSIRGLYYYKLSVNLDPVSLQKHVKLAQAYAGIHAYEEAEQIFQESLDLADSFEEEMFVYNSYSKNKSSSESPSGAEAQSQGVPS